jgi:hypothetical protein
MQGCELLGLVSGFIAINTPSGDKTGFGHFNKDAELYKLLLNYHPAILKL